MHHPRHHCFCLSSCPQRVLFTRQSQTAPAVHVVQNARPFYRTGRRSHITPNVALLHWLPFNSQIVFKITLTVITCKALYGFAPFYISALLTLKHQWLASINQKPLPLPLKHGMKRFHDKVWLSWSWYFLSNWTWCFFFFSPALKSYIVPSVPPQSKHYGEGDCSPAVLTPRLWNNLPFD